MDEEPPTGVDPACEEAGNRRAGGDCCGGAGLLILPSWGP